MLSQSGEAGLTRKFVRPKGFVSLAWKASPLLDLSVKLEREVGQLDFFDFVASANVSGGTTDAGNVNLVPQQSWNLELEATRNLGRSEKRRVGNEWVSTCSSRLGPYHTKKKE